MKTSTARNQQATDLDGEVRQLVREVDQAWLRIGRLCDQCNSQGLYRELGFRSFDDWILAAAGQSRSRAYVAMRVARNLVPIRDVDLAQITTQNADILSRVPMSRQAALIKAAQTQTERDFRQTDEASVPGLHLEAKVHVEFWVPRSLLDVIERCIKKAMVLNEPDSRTAAVEAIFSEYDVGHADLEKEREADRQEASSR